MNDCGRVTRRSNRDPCDATSHSVTVSRPHVPTRCRDRCVGCGQYRGATHLPPSKATRPPFGVRRFWMFADGDLPRQAYKFPSSKGVCGFLETVTCAGGRTTKPRMTRSGDSGPLQEAYKRSSNLRTPVAKALILSHRQS